MVRDDLGDFEVKKTLSVKVSTNKEDFGIVGRFLVRWKFDFWVVKLGKCLILVGFDDMGYDKWFEGRRFGILLDFVGDLMIKEGWIFELVCG